VPRLARKKSVVPDRKEEKKNGNKSAWLSNLRPRREGEGRKVPAGGKGKKTVRGTTMGGKKKRRLPEIPVPEKGMGKKRGCLDHLEKEKNRHFLTGGRGEGKNEKVVVPGYRGGERRADLVDKIKKGEGAKKKGLQAMLRGGKKESSA